MAKRPPALIESHQADAFTDLSLRDPKALRQMLLAETELLKTQSAYLQAEFKAELARIKKEAKEAKDTRLSEHAIELVQSLAAIRQGLYRAEIARTSDHLLLDEWHEWERLGSIAGASMLKQRLARERQEMIRSELNLRNIRLPEARREQVVTREVTTPVQQSSIEPQEAPEVKSPAAPEDWLAVWETERRAWVDENESYWNEVTSQIDFTVLDPVDAAQLLRLKRAAHAEKRLADRSRGRR